MGDVAAISGHHLLVEVGWEVCWQLGGIYTVLRSKAPSVVKEFGDNYCLVGPYNHETAETEFEPRPLSGPFGRAAQLLCERGIPARYGRWLIAGRPQVVLIDFRACYDRLASYKYYLYKDHFIETVNDGEVDGVVLFGYLVAEFLDVLAGVVRDPSGSHVPGAFREAVGLPTLPILAHFHEWMAAVAIPEVLRRLLPVATVFTTHATLLGRYLASNDPQFYDSVPHIDPWRAAESMDIKPRYAIERAAAQSATVLTTISGITGYEAGHFLGRAPEVLLPNGLNIQRFTALHEFQNLHATYKRKIHELIVAHFFPSYTFDLDKTLCVLTSGRYEYSNKGYDLFVEALARLNWRLKNHSPETTVVAFLITRAPNRGVSAEGLRSQALFHELDRGVGDIAKQIHGRLLEQVAFGRIPSGQGLIDENDQIRLRRMSQAFRRKGLPPIVTHDMIYDAEDALLNKIRSCYLFNAREDRVKILFHPEFMSRTNPLLGIDYDEFVRGCNLGVFPSYYEPWGYTPMECAALGVPSITSDLSGFGGYVQTQIPQHDDVGLYVLERRYRSFDQAANQLCDRMFEVVTMDRRRRIEQRNRVEAESIRFDWQNLIANYWDALTLAASRVVGPFAADIPAPPSRLELPELLLEPVTAAALPKPDKPIRKRSGGGRERRSHP
ncbi:MAG: glycogen synthase [Myxococcota bacterium]|jgi:glycogen(starch) synthase|nr:glycogen synthase [Myxococcota bacterium]